MFATKTLSTRGVHSYQLSGICMFFLHTTKHLCLLLLSLYQSFTNCCTSALQRHLLPRADFTESCFLAQRCHLLLPGWLLVASLEYIQAPYLVPYSGLTTKGKKCPSEQQFEPTWCACTSPKPNAHGCFSHQQFENLVSFYGISPALQVWGDVSLQHEGVCWWASEPAQNAL